MLLLKMLGFWASLSSILIQVASNDGDIVFQRSPGRYLGNCLIRSLTTESEFDCNYGCLNEPECASVNYKMEGENKGLCELNFKTLHELPEEGQRKSEYVYSEVEKRSCKENEEFIQETKKCKEFFRSCNDVLTRYPNSTNGIYNLKSTTTGKYYDVYCHMTDIATCGGGGWTLVMKIDGNKNTFSYDSVLWNNTKTYAIQDGLDGMAEKESKLASYSNTPFTKICLGMSYSGEQRWMTFDYTASSLYSVIGDGRLRPLNLGRAPWKSLIAGSSLQRNCEKQGFNVPFNGNSFLRIGIVANNENNCDSCDSWIGFSISYFTNALKQCTYAPSCRDLLLKKPSLPNGAYSLQQSLDSLPYKVYCHMDIIPDCGVAGWTLAMKVDGNMPTFYYNSPLWTNKEAYAVEDGLEGLTEKESKLASYWNNPFQKVCLGMTVNGNTKHLMLNYQASSLYSAIADGEFRGTSAGKTNWMSMIEGSSLQQHCNQEGFNINLEIIYVRFGFVANNEKHCSSCDSWVAFGVHYDGCHEEDRACGNHIVCGAQVTTNIPAFGYIFVQ